MVDTHVMLMMQSKRMGISFSKKSQPLLAAEDEPPPPPAMAVTSGASGSATTESSSGGGGGGVYLAAFNIAKDAFSVSSLSLPFAMASAGFGLAVILLISIGLSSMYTGILLVTATKDAARLPGANGQRITSYMELGRISMGRFGEGLVAVVSVLTCLGAAAGWFIAIGMSPGLMIMCMSD